MSTFAKSKLGHCDHADVFVEELEYALRVMRALDCRMLPCRLSKSGVFA
jgi:hypothetical protein